MATSGTYNFAPEINDIVVEAFQRIMIDEQSLTIRHLQSARMSMNLLFIDWENRGFKQWKMEDFTLTPSTVGQQSFTLNARVIRIFNAFHRRDNYDTPMSAVSRTDYKGLHNKTTQASRPDRYFFDRQLAAPILYVWPTLDNITDNIIITTFVNTQDVGDPSNTPDLERHWLDAVCSGLSARLAEKWNRSVLDDARASAADAFVAARRNDRENSDLTMTVNLGRRPR